jgi:hypothetical protein
MWPSLTLAAAQNALTLSGYSSTYAAAGQAYGINPSLLAAQGYQESSFNPNASNGTAYGIAQFEPATAQQYGVNRSSATSSIYGQAQYDATLIAQNNGNVGAALQQYSGNTPGYSNAIFQTSGLNNSTAINGVTSSGYTAGQGLNVAVNATSGSSVLPSSAGMYAGMTQSQAQALGYKPASGVLANTTGLPLITGNASVSCGMSPSCWWNSLTSSLAMDSLTIFLFFFAVLLVFFGMYKLSGVNAGQVAKSIPLE